MLGFIRQEARYNARKAYISYRHPQSLLGDSGGLAEFDESTWCNFARRASLPRIHAMQSCRRWCAPDLLMTDLHPALFAHDILDFSLYFINPVKQY
jgi:hypothetical protein